MNTKVLYNGFVALQNQLAEDYPNGLMVTEDDYNYCLTLFQKRLVAVGVEKSFHLFMVGLVKRTISQFLKGLTVRNIVTGSDDVGEELGNIIELNLSNLTHKNFKKEIKDRLKGLHNDLRLNYEVDVSLSNMLDKAQKCLVDWREETSDLVKSNFTDLQRLVKFDGLNGLVWDVCVRKIKEYNSGGR